MPRLTKAAGKSLEAQHINEKLENIKTNISVNGINASAIGIRMSRPKRSATPASVWAMTAGLLQIFNEYLADFLKRIDKDRAYSTYEDYCLRRRRLAAFLEYEYHVKDIPFKEPKGDFIDKFVVYLSTVKGIASGTIHAGVKKTSSDDLYGV